MRLREIGTSRQIDSYESLHFNPAGMLKAMLKTISSILLLLGLSWHLAEPLDTSEVEKIIVDLNSTDHDTVLYGLNKAIGGFGRGNPVSGDQWKRIAEQCNAIVRGNASDLRRSAAHVLSVACVRRPSFRAEFLESITIALDRKLKDEDRCVLIQYAGGLGLKSEMAAKRLRAEINSLEDGIPFVSINAISAVSRLSPDQGDRIEMVDLLLAFLKHKEDRARYISADALGQLLKSDPCIPVVLTALRKLLNDSNSTVRACSARAIVRLSEDKSVRSALLSVLDSEETVFFSYPVAPSIYAYGPHVTSYMIALDGLARLESSDGETIDAIAKVLQSGSVFAAHQAAFHLSDIIGDRTVSQSTRNRLQAALNKSADPDVRRICKEILSAR